MKRVTFLALILCMSAMIALVGCAGKTTSTGPKSTVSKQDLLHHNFVLTHVNGKPFLEKERTPNIEFNEGFRVSGATCNRFMGQAELENGVLTVKHMASTMMFCADDDLNKLEQKFSQMMEGGAAITLKDNILTLSREGYTLRYILRDHVK